MIEQIKSPRFVVLSLLIMLAACTRILPLLIPHTWNFTAIGALAIFAGSQFKDLRCSFIVPLIAMFLSDLFLGQGFASTVYLGLMAMVACGVFIRGKINPTRIGMASLVGALIFYLLTNFVCFYPASIHPQTFAGAIESYVVALPFLRNMLVGDLFYGVLLFGGFYLIEKRYPALVIG